ncbi:MAG: hypothetical protein WBD40_07200 [Tepidisphaeraceae bacterium]
MHIDSLESRRLFAATAYLDGEVLRVVGTEGDDVIRFLNPAGPTTGNSTGYRVAVQINGSTIELFAATSFTRISIEARTGNDDIEAPGRFITGRSHLIGGGSNETFTMEPRYYIECGGGDDRVTTGSTFGEYAAIGSPPGGEFGRNDTIIGGDGHDTLDGGKGDDLISGGGGNDVLRGGSDDDTLEGGNGADTLDGGIGADLTLGGRGVDTVDYSTRTEDLAIVLGKFVPRRNWSNDGVTGRRVYPDNDLRSLHGSGGLEGDQITRDVENATGGAGDDVILGSGAYNALSGGAGNDTLYGGFGNDTLAGNDGDDLFYSADNSDNMPAIGPPGIHPGSDRLLGGGGRDRAIVEGYDTQKSVEVMDVLPFLTS